MPAEVRQEKNHNVYLDRRSKKWKKEAANRDVSIYSRLPFNPLSHVVEPATAAPIKAAKKADQRTKNEDGSHQANVCIVCDELIMGVEALCWIDEEFLQSTENINRLGVARYSRHYILELKPELVKQYTVSGLEGMLLSPRSKRSTDNKRTCCECCFNSLNRARKKGTGQASSNDEDFGPPKKAIANGFACGHIPTQFLLKKSDGSSTIVTIKEDDLTDVLCAFLSPTRAYGYYFAYSGGAHKSLRGHFFLLRE